MSASTGPILATAAVTAVNRSIFNGKPFDWRLPVAAGIAVALAAGAEQLIGGGPVRGFALIGLFAVCLTRVDPTVPSPAESAVTWLNARR